MADVTQSPNDQLGNSSHKSPAAAQPTGSTTSVPLPIRDALSKARFEAYRLPSDRGDLDVLARYAYNVALGSALYPLLHTLEVTLRNRMYQVIGSKYPYNARANKGVACWLDFQPTILTPREVDMVEEAKKHCVRPRKSRPRTSSPGRLVAALPLGFWVNLFNSPYEHGDKGYGQFWPKLLKSIFPSMDPSHRTRRHLLDRLNAIKNFRNRVFHYEPIWNDGLAAEHAQIIETIGWMNRDAARLARHFDTVPQAIAAGSGAFRTLLEQAFLSVP